MKNNILYQVRNVKSVLSMSINRFVIVSGCTFPLILGPFLKLQNVSVSTVISVCPSAWRNLSTTGRMFIKFGVFILKIFPEFKVLIKIYNNKAKFAWISVNIHDKISLNYYLRMRNVPHKIVQNVHILYSVKFFPKIGLLFINMEKCGGQQTGDRPEYKTAQALLMLEN